MATYTIQDTTLTNIANAIRDKWAYPSTKTFTPAQMASKIQEMKISRANITPLQNNYNKWTRPNDWPDITSLPLPNASAGDCIYLTYDLTKVENIAAPFISLFIRPTAAATLTVDRGHISNGAFVSDESYTYSQGANSARRFYQELSSSNGDIQLWRITSTSALNRFGFIPDTTNLTRANMMQPCVERYGRLDGLTSLQSSDSCASTSEIAWGTYWLENDKTYMAGTGNCKSLSNLYNNCLSLRALDVSNWNTTNWNITTLLNAFNNCNSLMELDLSAWNTSNWAVTAIAQMFQNCTSLQHLKLGFNTTNWRVSNISYLFYGCQSLLELDLNWNTSSWTMTDCSYAFAYCCSLQKLNLNYWDTSNWNVKTLEAMFSNCYSLKELNVDEWDTSSWSLTSFISLFYECNSLETLDLSSWEVDAWRPTSLNQVFSMMTSLKELDLTTWDVSSWSPTSISNCFSYLISLQKLDIHTWNTSGWTSLPNLSQAFARIQAREIYLPSSFAFNGTYNSSNAFYFNIPKLMKFSGFGYYKNNHSYAECKLLDHESLVNILNELQTVSSRTITLGVPNQNKLTAAEIAIATAKGWTVA